MELDVSGAFRSILTRASAASELFSASMPWVEPGEPHYVQGKHFVFSGKTALKNFVFSGNLPDVRGNPHVCAHGLLAPLSVVRSR